MKRMNPKNTFRVTSEINGFLTFLKNSRIFQRSVDGYTFAAAYAMKNNLAISPVSSRERQDLIYVRDIGDDVVLALEAGIHAVRKRNGQPEPADEKEVLDLVTQYAEAGLQLLKPKWEGKTSGQIQEEIQRIITEC
jgi:hypothetical protein